MFLHKDNNRYTSNDVTFLLKWSLKLRQVTEEALSLLF